MGGLFACSRTGANRFPGITCTIRAGASRRPPSLCWWKLFDTAAPPAAHENRSTQPKLSVARHLIVHLPAEFESSTGYVCTPLMNQWSFVAGGPGFEPRLPGPEPGVLPLNYPPSTSAKRHYHG